MVLSFTSTETNDYFELRRRIELLEQTGDEFPQKLRITFEDVVGAADVRVEATRLHRPEQSFCARLSVAHANPSRLLCTCEPTGQVVAKRDRRWNASFRVGLTRARSPRRWKESCSTQNDQARN